MDFYELVKQARTCRIFDQASKPGMEGLRWLVECARCAPSARNEQQLRFMLVTDPVIIAKLGENVRWAKRGGNAWQPTADQSPTGYVAIIAPAQATELVTIDVGIAAQTIQLAAASRGWGACMIWSFSRDATPVILEVPPEMRVALLIAVGAQAQKRELAELPADGSTAYYDRDGVHYVPKRPLSQLIVREFPDQA